MPNYCSNCGVQLKKKKGNCPQCGTPFVQDRKLQIPKKYQSIAFSYKKSFGELPPREEGNLRETVDRESPLFHLYEAFDLEVEVTNFLMDAIDLLVKKVLYLARKEIYLKYGLISDILPNFCSNCGRKIDGDLKSCPTCEKPLVYEKLEYEKAIGYVQKALALDPTNGDIKLILKWALRVIEEQNDPKSALRYLTLVIDHHLSVVDHHISMYKGIIAILRNKLNN